MSGGPPLAAAALAALLPLSACVTYPPGWDAQRGSDPYQGVNRPIFSFNDGVDRYLLGPVADGWSFITPEALRKSVEKFFNNLAFPARLVANLGQGEVRQAGSELGRFLLNTTLGVAGFFDPATHFGVGYYDEDFGQMFGRWGIPPGPYWVLPLLGPSNPRDALGLLFDSVLNLRTALVVVPGAGAGATVVDTVNRRALADEAIEDLRAAALDYYVSVRDAYLQRRRALVANQDVEEEPAPAREGLYELDEALYDLEEEGADAAEEEAADAAEEEADGAP